MIVGLDSAFAPSVAQAQAARTAGIGVWSGYLATKPNVGLYHPWSLLDFQAAKLVGGIPIAYASGWDDPVACKTLAAAWGVRLCLDVEGGIRPDGSWVQGWLDASGAGLYGLAATHQGRRAAFHIMAWYPGYNPGLTWPQNISRPSTPCGWQWQNTHQEFGVGVDRCWLDPWFGPSSNATAGEEVIVPQEEPMTLSEKWAHIRTQYLIAQPDIAPDNTTIGGWAAKIADDGNNVDAIIQQLWQAEPTFAAYRNRLTAALNAKPTAGPPGPPGPAVDTAQFAAKDHPHIATTTIK